MKISKTLNFLQYFMLIAMFGIGISEMADVWNLKMTLVFFSYVGLAFSVALMRQEIQEMREQLRNMQQ